MKRISNALFILTVIFSCALPVRLAAQATSEEAILAYNAALELAKGEDLQAAITGFLKAADLATKAGDTNTKQLAEKQITPIQYNIAAALYEEKKYEEMIQALKKTIEYADLYGDQVNKDKALKILPTVYFNLGNDQLRDKQFDAALATFDEAIAMDAEMSRAYLGKFMVLLQQNKLDEAMSVADLGIEKAKANNDATIQTALQDRARNNFKSRAGRLIESNPRGALSLLEGGLKYGEDSDMHYLMARAYNAMKQFDNAISAANKSLAMAKGSAADKAKINFELGMAQNEKKNKTAACTAFKAAAFGQFKANADYYIKQLACP